MDTKVENSDIEMRNWKGEIRDGEIRGVGLFNRGELGYCPVSDCAGSILLYLT
jgi:hypothetical protein